MKKALIVIDMQNDFIDGSLGTAEALSIVENVKDKIRSYPPECVFATMDTHGPDYLSTQEGRNLPVEHCIRGTEGWKIRPDIEELLKGARIFEKPTFGSERLAEELKKEEDLEEIELIGLCTDICVVSNALLIKAALPELKISVDASCCAGVTPRKHLAALETMRSCQINVTGAAPVRLSVIYDSRTGNTARAAEWIADGIRRAGAEAACFKTDEVDEEYVKSSAGVILGCPTYMAQMTADMHRWIQEKAGKLGLGGKLGGAFATEQYTHGGAELVIQSILEMELVFGMTVYSSGSTQGRPCIHIGPVGVNGNQEAHNSLEHYRTYFELYGERMARMAAELFG